MAAKHIILLSDGTGNSSASLFKTNVRRIYEALDLADPQKPKIPRQFAFYDDGVGTSSFRPWPSSEAPLASAFRAMSVTFTPSSVGHTLMATRSTLSASAGAPSPFGL